jgi:hypothetical protein
MYRAFSNLHAARLALPQSAHDPLATFLYPSHPRPRPREGARLAGIVWCGASILDVGVVAAALADQARPPHRTKANGRPPVLCTTRAAVMSSATHAPLVLD